MFCGAIRGILIRAGGYQKHLPRASPPHRCLGEYEDVKYLAADLQTQDRIAITSATSGTYSLTVHRIHLPKDNAYSTKKCKTKMGTVV